VAALSRATFDRWCTHNLSVGARCGHANQGVSLWGACTQMLLSN